MRSAAHFAWFAGCLITVMSSAHVSAADRRPLPFALLEKNCALEIRWIGVVQERPEGAFLVCDGEAFLVLQPSNLLGHVEITNADAALQFVRLFTSASTYRLFDLEGLVEIEPAEARAPASERRFNQVDAKLFDKYFSPPRATSFGRDSPKMFVIERYVVAPGNRVYLVRETVLETGYYTRKIVRLIARDGAKYGLMHRGDL